MATENEQQGPVKNRWTRWYMWFAYGSAVLVVVIIIAAVTSSGDSATATPEDQAASSESTRYTGLSPSRLKKPKIRRSQRPSIAKL